MLTNLFSRRQMLKTVSGGFGYLAFAGLSTQQATAAATNPLALKAPHFPAKAKRIIFLCMQGGPSHLDTFDYKPLLKAGNPATSSYMPSPFPFQQHGKSGLWVSDLFPNVA